jgi:RNA polymerase sigma-70 factor (ECF subfamily)
LKQIVNNHHLPTTDQDLLLEASRGDAEAFGELYERYLDQIYRYVHYRLPAAEEAEDLTEQIFLKTWELIRKGGKAAKIENFRAWLYRVAHNQVVDYHRKKQPLTVDMQENSGLFGKSGDDTEGDVQKNLDQQDLLEAILTLDLQSQEIIAMRFIHGLSHAEVAEALELKPGHARVLQHRALTKLRKIMQEVNDE